MYRDLETTDAEGGGRGEASGEGVSRAELRFGPAINKKPLFDTTRWISMR